MHPDRRDENFVAHQIPIENSLIRTQGNSKNLKQSHAGHA